MVRHTPIMGEVQGLKSVWASSLVFPQKAKNNKRKKKKEKKKKNREDKLKHQGEFFFIQFIWSLAK